MDALDIKEAGDAVGNIDAIRAQLSRIECQRRELERQIEVLQRQKLTALPLQVGLSSVDSLLVALIPYTSSTLRAKLRAIGVDQMPLEFAAASEPSGKRMKFSAQLKAQIREELERRRKSVPTLSREFGPSPSTIMSWKREWGMTRPSRPLKKLTVGGPAG